MIPSTTGSFSLFFMGEGDFVATAIILAWAGTAFAASMTISPAMQADVIDYDELYTGKRREAQYGALWSIVTKFAIIPSSAVPLAVLARSRGVVVPKSNLAYFGLIGLAYITIEITLSQSTEKLAFRQDETATRANIIIQTAFVLRP